MVGSHSHEHGVLLERRTVTAPIAFGTGKGFSDPCSPLTMKTGACGGDTVIELILPRPGAAGSDCDEGDDGTAEFEDCDNVDRRSEGRRKCDRLKKLEGRVFAAAIVAGIEAVDEMES